MPLQHISIGKRLGLAFAVLTLFIATMLAVGIWRLQAVAQSTADMMARPLSKERVISDWYRNIPEEQMGGVIGVACPQIIYPYLRGNVADIVTRAGFPPVHLAEINFQAMYEQQNAAAAAQAEGSVQ